MAFRSITKSLADLVSGAFSRPIFKRENHGNNKEKIKYSQKYQSLISRSKRYHKAFALLESSTDTIKPSIAAGILTVNSRTALVSVKSGRKNTEPNQPADRFINHADKANRYSFVNSSSGNLAINNKSSIYKFSFQLFFVIPAPAKGWSASGGYAGIQSEIPTRVVKWIPAFAGMTIALFLILLSLINTSSPVSADSNWWNYAWGWRKQLSFNNTSSNLGVSPENLTNFPVLVKLTGSNFDFSKAQGSGQDIRFVDSDNATQLSYEIESWDSTNKQAFIWVRVPQIDSASSSDYIYMYYGNPSVTDAQSASSVWDSNYKGVWHLKEGGSGAANEYIDSTSNSNHGQGGGGTVANVPTLTSSGQFDGSQSFDGTNDRISFSANTIGSDVNGASGITISSWVYVRSYAGSAVRERFFSATINSNSTALSLSLFNGANLEAGGRSTSSDSFQTTTTSAPSLEQWAFITGILDYANDKIILYKNGSSSVETPVTFNSSTYTHGTATVIDSMGAGSVGEQVDAIMDEVRISNTARSAAWIAADYKSGTDSFVSVSGEGVVSAGQSISLSNSITSGSNGKSRISGSVSSDNSSFVVSSVECSTNGGAFSPATASDGGFNSTKEDFYYDFLASDSAWGGAGYTIRCKAVRSGGTVVDNVFFFAPFTLESPLDDAKITDGHPTFFFLVNKQRDRMGDNISKYQIQVKKGNDTSWQTYIDDIPVNRVDGDFETEKIFGNFSDSGSKITVRSKVSTLAGIYQWRAVSLDKQNHSQQSESRTLWVATTDSSLLSSMALTPDFPLSILHITGIGNIDISTNYPIGIKDSYTSWSTAPTFYGIAFANAKVTLDLTDQDCLTSSTDSSSSNEESCTKTYSTVANGESRFGINVPKGDLTFGKKYTTQLSAILGSEYTAIPTFTLNITGTTQPKPTLTPDNPETLGSTTQQPTPTLTPQPAGEQPQPPEKNCFLFWCF